MRVVIDTDVMVSGVLNPYGPPGRIDLKAVPCNRSELGGLFQDVHECACTIDPATLRLAHAIENSGPFQPLDGALRRRKGDAQFGRSSRRN